MSCGLRGAEGEGMLEQGPSDASEGAACGVWGQTEVCRREE